jgi:predicted AAA+ superfamily ATPase
LEKTFERIQFLWKPVATEEAFEIVRRRLFEPVRDEKERETVCRAFADQIQQAKKELKTAEDVLPRVAREYYKWFLCPAQPTPTDPNPQIEVTALNTSSSGLCSEIEKVCVDNELVITTWSPIHLRTELKKLYWKADKPAIGAMTFWEDTQRYLYLPRLKTIKVISNKEYPIV